MSMQAAMQKVVSLAPSSNLAGRVRPVDAELTQGDQELVDWLRLAASRQRVCSRIDLDRACQLIAADPKATADRYTTALLKAMAEFSRSRASLYQVGAASQSHFELWFVRLIHCLQSGDELSVRMLLGSYVKPAGQRRVCFLATGLASALRGQI